MRYYFVVFLRNVPSNERTNEGTLLLFIITSFIRSKVHIMYEDMYTNERSNQSINQSMQSRYVINFSLF